MGMQSMLGIWAQDAKGPQNHNFGRYCFFFIINIFFTYKNTLSNNIAVK